MKTQRVIQSLELNPVKEPAINVGAVTSAVTGALAMLLYFFPNLLSSNQLAVIGIAGAFLVPIITALLTRGKVWSPQSVLDVLEQAVREGKRASTHRLPAKPTPDANDELEEKWPN